MIMTDCIFCKIIKGEIPCSKVYEDEEFIAFLDIMPTSPGQTLVVPKKHCTSYAVELDEDIYTKTLLLAKKIAKAIDKALGAKVSFVMEGFQVPHFHVRLHPCPGGYLSLKHMDPKPTDVEFKEIVEKIKKELGQEPNV